MELNTPKCNHLMPLQRFKGLNSSSRNHLVYFKLFFVFLLISVTVSLLYVHYEFMFVARESIGFHLQLIIG